MLIAVDRLRAGESGVVQSIGGGRGIVRRLEHLGVRPGKVLAKVSSQFMAGPVTVTVDGRQVAMGMRLASFPFFGRRITPLAVRHGLPKVLKYLSSTLGHMEPEEQARFIEMNRIPGTARAFQRTLEGVINVFGQFMQTTQRASEVDELPPIALFWGRKDPIIPVRHGRDSVKRSHEITLTTYDCGHYPHLDVPEVFATDLLEFLADTERAAARIRRQYGGTRP